MLPHAEKSTHTSQTTDSYTVTVSKRIIVILLKNQKGLQLTRRVNRYWYSKDEREALHQCASDSKNFYVTCKVTHAKITPK